MLVVLAYKAAKANAARKGGAAALLAGLDTMLAVAAMATAADTVAVLGSLTLTDADFVLAA